MREDTLMLGGARTVAVRPSAPPSLVVVLLHGYAMRPEDLAPFAHSMRLDAAFYCPEGGHHGPDGTRAWWPIDEERRAESMARGPRDLRQEDPPGAAAARIRLAAIVAELMAEHPGLPLALVGFSQGGMLVSDAILSGALRASGVALLSSSRIAEARWAAQTSRLRDLPTLISHGLHDPDLSHAAGEGLREFYVSAGATVEWVSFDGAHEIPLIVWRRLKVFLSGLSRPAVRSGP